MWVEQQLSTWGAAAHPLIPWPEQQEDKEMLLDLVTYLKQAKQPFLAALAARQQGE